MTKRPSGKCQKCPYTWNLKKDGTLQTHRLYHGGSVSERCEGSGLPPREAT